MNACYSAKYQTQHEKRHNPPDTPINTREAYNNNQRLPEPVIAHLVFSLTSQNFIENGGV